MVRKSKVMRGTCPPLILERLFVTEDELLHIVALTLDISMPIVDT